MNSEEYQRIREHADAAREERERRKRNEESARTRRNNTYNRTQRQPRPRYSNRTSSSTSSTDTEQSYEVTLGIMTFIGVGIYLLGTNEELDLIRIGIISLIAGLIVRYTVDFVFKLVGFVLTIISVAVIVLSIIYLITEVL